MEENDKAKGYAEKLVTVLAKKLDIDISKYDMGELVQGMLVELEHGSQNEKTNITNDEPEMTLKIVIAHVDEIKDYYTRLDKMESGSDKQESSKDDNLKTESTSKRFKELCGISENENKKQLKNLIYQEKPGKSLLKEEIDPEKFKVVKFENDGLGAKETKEDTDLYKMQEK